MDKIKLSMIVNEKPVSVEIKPYARLLDVIREELGLTGTKEGCGVGECGACTIIVDGKAVNSCMVLAASMEGKHITCFLQSCRTKVFIFKHTKISLT